MQACMEVYDPAYLSRYEDMLSQVCTVLHTRHLREGSSSQGANMSDKVWGSSRMGHI